MPTSRTPTPLPYRERGSTRHCNAVAPSPRVGETVRGCGETGQTPPFEGRCACPGVSARDVQLAQPNGGLVGTGARKTERVPRARRACHDACRGHGADSNQKKAGIRAGIIGGLLRMRGNMDKVEALARIELPCYILTRFRYMNLWIPS